MPIETIISLSVAIIALVFTALSFRRTSNKDNTGDAMERATITADLRYIRAAIDDIKLEYKSLQKDISDLRDRIVTVEQSTKSAHKRMDDYVKQHGAETNRYTD